MALAAHDAVVKAIADLCLASPALAGGNVDTDIEADELPEGTAQGIQVGLLDSQPLRRLYGRVEWLTTVRVSCRVRSDRFDASNGRPSMQLGAAVYSRVIGSVDLGGLATQVEPPRLSTDVTLLRTRVGVLNLDFPVRHSTEAAALT